MDHGPFAFTRIDAMSCTLTVDGPCRRTLNFTIDRALVDAQVAAGLRELAGRASFKGFRPGKVPLDLVKKTHGKAVAEDVRRTLMSRAFQEAISEHKLQPVGEPVLNLQQLQDEPGGPFTFSLDVEVMPEFELAPLAGLPVTVELPTVDVAMVESEVERLRRQAGTLNDAPADTVVGPDSVLLTTLTYTVEGESLPPRAERPVMPKHDILDGYHSAGSGAAFLGKRAGDDVELQLTLPPQIDPKELAGKAATVAAHIDSHRLAVSAPLDESFFQRVGVANADELRQRIGEALTAQRAQMRDTLVDRAIERKLIELHSFELPERLLAKAIDRRVHEAAHQLIEKQGLDPEAGHAQAEAQRESITTRTRAGVHASFVLSRIAQKQELSATVAEAEAEVRRLAAEQNANAEELVATARREGWLGDVAAQLTEQKTRAWLRGQAHVTETAPAPPAA